MEKEILELIHEVDTTLQLLMNKKETLKVAMSDARSNGNEDLHHEKLIQFKDTDEQILKLSELRKNLLKKLNNSVDVDKKFKAVVLKSEQLFEQR
ncbi:hypothetical protein [Aeribacillus pallidus]|uniref:hypothetical protein n=1 Tax=Aeribacillus pallidus TaxID=33936 RepID=UPI003D1D4522